MLAGLPVVSSPLKQVKDLLTTTEGIFFAEPDNPEDLISICNIALLKSADSELRQRIHNKAYINYTFETDSKALEEFMNRNLNAS